MIVYRILVNEQAFKGIDVIRLSGSSIAVSNIVNSRCLLDTLTDAEMNSMLSGL